MSKGSKSTISDYHDKLNTFRNKFPILAYKPGSLRMKKNFDRLLNEVKIDMTYLNTGVIYLPNFVKPSFPPLYDHIQIL